MQKKRFDGLLIGPRAARGAASAGAALLLALMEGCGGGGGGASSVDASSNAGGAGGSVAGGVGAGGAVAGAGGAGASGGGSGGASAGPNATALNTSAAASRFLTQATYGPTSSEIARLSAMTFSAWIDEQFAKPQVMHRDYLNQASADLAATGGSISPNDFFDSYWAQAIGGSDQLRQRAVFALSEIFVISFNDATVRNQPRGVASYYDMLGTNAFANFRTLLEAVSLHPMMGIYLSSIKNQKEDATTGRVPDLNFAREVTQLFTVGQYKLNPDGTVITGSGGAPVPAYTADDLSGLSQVFTGWSWYAGTQTTDRSNSRYFGNNANVERDWRPMQDYNHFTANTDFHSISTKSFFGVTIPAQTLATADTAGDLKIGLDTLFNNPNVGPFVGKQLIQRLVTSNPSSAYVGRVAAAFNNNGAGVRGDMKAVWKAVLLDPEARTPPAAAAAGASASSGKVREPLVRLANFMRAFNTKSLNGRYQGIGNTDDPATRLNQTVMSSPTVFNFFRPGYVPSSQAIGDAKLVAPEFQIVNDVAVAGYMNYIRAWVSPDANRDLQQDFSAELAAATTPADLVERMNLLLFYGQMPDALRTQLVAAVTSRVIPAPMVAVTATTGGTLSKLADENGSFTLTATATVRYGAGTTFVEKSVTGTGQCSNDFFGSDPIVGSGKACYLFTPTPVAGAPAASTPAAPPSNQAAIDSAKRDRVSLAIFMSMASPDYLVQK